MTHFTATATIHRGHLRHNLDVIRRQQPGAPVMAMVKANAYGHGLVDVARAIGSVDSLAVARIEEAEQLRAAGIDKPLVLLEGVFDAQGMTAAAALGCELVVHTPEQIALLRQHPDSDAFVTWLKLDSGMHRLGFDIADAASAIGALRGIDAVRELRLMSHYASADDRASDFSQRQFERMRPVLEIFDGAISLANSPALLRDDAPALDGASGRAATGVWLRPGIAVYGISPFDGVPAASLDLRPAMDFETRLISVRDIKAGDSVGYGGRFVAPGRMRIGIAAVGYGDGYPRMMPDGAPVIVDGRACAIAGRVSMDMLSVDLTGAPEAAVGSTVQLWGALLPAEHVAAAVGTIAYELVTRVSERVRREYR